MATKKKTPKSPKRKGNRKVAPQITAPANIANQNVVAQPTQPVREHEQITAARISGRLTIMGVIIAATIPVIVTTILGYPGFLIDVNAINASRATQTAQAFQPQPSNQTATPSIIYTSTATETTIPTSTVTVIPEYWAIRNFLEELSLLTETSIYESKWELLTEYYCGKESSEKLENFKNWIKTLGTNAVGRRLIENPSLEISANPKVSIDWKVSQIEIWLFSGDRQQLTLKHTSKYTYYLDKTVTDTFCIVDYDIDWVSIETLQK